MNNDESFDDRNLLSLSFVGTFVDPDHVTAILQIQPSESHKVGEPFPRNPRQRRRFGVWVLESNLSNDLPLLDHIQHMIEILRPKSHELATLRAEGYEPTFYVGYFFQKEGQILLNSTMLQQLHSLSITLDLRLYCRHRG